MGPITRRTVLARAARLPLLIIGWAIPTPANSAEVGLATTAKEDDFAAKLWKAGKRLDLRLAIFSDDSLRERIRKGTFSVGTYAEHQTEHAAKDGLTVEAVLKSFPEKRLNQWKGTLPTIVLISRDRIILGTNTENFLSHPIMPGDALLFGTIE